jgi:hypothetical protein
LWSHVALDVVCVDKGPSWSAGLSAFSVNQADRSQLIIQLVWVLPDGAAREYQATKEVSENTIDSASLYEVECAYGYSKSCRRSSRSSSAIRTICSSCGASLSLWLCFRFRSWRFRRRWKGMSCPFILPFGLRFVAHFLGDVSFSGVDSGFGGGLTFKGLGEIGRELPFSM